MKDFLPETGKMKGILFLAFFLCFNVYLGFAQTLTSDKDDYAPGTTATFTGSGFLPYEQVKLQVLHADETPDTGDEHHVWFVDADENGGFVTTWHVCEDDCLGSTLRAYADGMDPALPARHAWVEFTDSGSFSYVTTSGKASSINIASGATNSTGLSTDIEVPKNNGSFNATLSGFITTSGTTIGIGPGTNQINISSVQRSFVTTSNASVTKTFPVTVSIGSAVPTGTYNFKATIPPTSGVNSGGGWAFDVVVIAACTQPIVTTVNSCVSGSTVQFTQSGGNAGGKWTVSGGGTINEDSGVFTPDVTVGCFTATYRTPTGNCTDTKSFVIFPAAPAAPVVSNTCNSALTIPALSTVSGFTAQYSFDNGTNWGTSPTSTSSSPGCYSMKTRYVLTSACGSIPANTTAPAACASSATGNAIIYPSAPVAPVVSNTCDSDLTIPSLTSVTDFTAQYSFDNGTSWGTSNTSASKIPGCYSMKTRYVFNGSCGTASTAAPGACAVSGIGNAVIFPNAPPAPTVNEGCGAITVTPPSSISGFNIQYSFNNGVTWGANTPPTADNCDGYDIRTRYVLTAACGSNPADTASPIAACASSPATNRVMDNTAPSLSGTPYSDPTDYNACIDDAETTVPAFSEASAIEGYSDNCSPVTASLTNTETTGIDCSWTVIYTYTVSDSCGNELPGQTYTHSGSDQDAPTGVTPSEVTGINACANETEIDGLYPTADDETALETAYTDDCGTVTATFVSQTLSGDSCSWSLDRTYTISDGCSGNDFDVTMTYSGSDQDAPTGVTPSEGTGINACANETEIDGLYPTADDETALETAYTDDCGTVTATFVSQTLSGDSCSWSLDRTYTISDGCSGNDFDVTMTYSGSDQDAPTGVTPSEGTGINACANETEIDGLYPTADDETALETAYTDDCGTVTATFVSQTLSGDSCSWSLDRTFTISDGCSGNDFNVTMTYSGSDQDAPILTNLVIPTDPQQIGSTFELSAAYSDCSIVTGVFSLTNGSIIVPPIEAEVSNGKISLSELDASNLEPGVYTVSLTAIDDCLNSITVTYPDFLVIYDPSGGFVTGGGWFYSEPEYLIDNPENSEGKANFGFNAKYKSGRNNTTEVDGHTNFQFKEGDFHFKSSSHEDMSLVISGGFKATYTGVGTINNDPTLYNFRVTVIDAEKTPAHDTDLFRIKIWNGGTTIYDNNINSITSENADPSIAIEGGSIVIHKPTSGKTKTMESTEKTGTQSTQQTAPDNLNSLEVAPNPMVSYTDIRFSLKAKLKADLLIFDMNGKQLRTLFSAVVNANEMKEVRFDRQNLMSGIYICKLVTGDGRSYEKQIIIE